MQGGTESAPLIKASDVAARIGVDKKRVRQKVSQLLRKREQYVERWKELQTYQLPHIGRFEGLDEDANTARRRDLKILNGKAWQANSIFAAGVMSGMTPPSQKWFKLRFGNKELADHTELGRLLDERVDIMMDVLAKSNFYSAVHSCYLELAMGQAPLCVFPDAKYGVHFTPCPVGTYCIESGPDGEIQTFVRRYRMTARQLADKFGIANLPFNVRKELEAGGHEATHRVIWFVEPNKSHIPGSVWGWELEYASLYYLEDSEEKGWLSIGGFHEWPVPVARYMVVGNESYGVGPAWFVEGDAKELQVVEKDKLSIAELTVKPAVKSTPDVMAKGINLVPGGNTVMMQNMDSVQPLFQVQGNLQHVLMIQQELEDRIKQAYSADLFLMLNQMENKTMTAQEVISRNQEKLQQLGPVVERMQHEFLGKIIERVYMILDREGLFPPPEDEGLLEALSSEEVRIEYISTLAQAQKMSGVVNLEQAVGFVGNLAAMKPEILNKVDFAEAVNQYFDMVGAPAAIRRSDDDYQAILDQQAAAAAEQQQLAQAGAVAQMAAPVAQAAKNATEAAADGNPALAQLMGMGPYQ